MASPDTSPEQDLPVTLADYDLFRRCLKLHGTLHEAAEMYLEMHPKDEAVYRFVCDEMLRPRSDMNNLVGENAVARIEDERARLVALDTEIAVRERGVAGARLTSHRERCRRLIAEGRRFHRRAETPEERLARLEEERDVAEVLADETPSADSRPSR